VYTRLGRDGQKNKIVSPNRAPSLRLSSPVTGMTIILPLTVALMFSIDYFVLPSRKDRRKK
jgi:hypothetical protein